MKLSEKMRTERIAAFRPVILDWADEVAQLEDCLESANLITEYALDSKDEFVDLFTKTSTENYVLRTLLKRIDADNTTASDFNAELWNTSGDFQMRVDALLTDTKATP